MATAFTQCPGCHQPVSTHVQSCPHCGVPLPAQSQPVAFESPLTPPFRPDQSQSSWAGASSIPPVVGQSHNPPPVAPLIQPLPDALKQIDTVASTQLTISGVLIAFYSGAIFAGKVLVINPLNAIIYTLPIFLLLITVILSIRVFYPGGYLTDDHAQLLKTKGVRLRHSSLLLEISVGVLAVSVLVYLLRPS